MKYKKRYFIIVILIVFLSVSFLFFAYLEKRSENNTKRELENLVEEELKKNNLTEEEVTEKILEEEAKYLEPEELERLKEILSPTNNNNE